MKLSQETRVDYLIADATVRPPGPHFGPTLCRWHTAIKPAGKEAADNDGEDGEDWLLVI